MRIHMTADQRTGVHPVMTLLMLSPLVAGTGSSGTALFLGLVSAGVLCVSTALLYLLQRLMAVRATGTDSAATVSTAMQLPLLMLVLSVTTSLVMLLLQRWFYEASLLTGIWLPLISANLLLVRQLLSVDSSQPIVYCLADAFKLGIVIVLALTGLALCRELLGNGLVLSNMHLFSDAMPAQGIELLPGWPRLKLFEMAPGALLLLALALAARRFWQARYPRPPADSGRPDPDRRVRVTGKIS